MLKHLKALWNIHKLFDQMSIVHGSLFQRIIDQQNANYALLVEIRQELHIRGSLEAKNNRIAEEALAKIEAHARTIYERGERLDPAVDFAGERDFKQSDNVKDFEHG